MVADSYLYKQLNDVQRINELCIIVYLFPSIQQQALAATGQDGRKFALKKNGIQRFRVVLYRTDLFPAVMSCNMAGNMVHITNCCVDDRR